MVHLCAVFRGNRLRVIVLPTCYYRRCRCIASYAGKPSVAQREKKSQGAEGPQGAADAYGSRQTTQPKAGLNVRTYLVFGYTLAEHPSRRTPRPSQIRSQRYACRIGKRGAVRVARTRYPAGSMNLSPLMNFLQYPAQRPI